MNNIDGLVEAERRLASALDVLDGTYAEAEGRVADLLLSEAIAASARRDQARADLNAATLQNDAEAAALCEWARHQDDPQLIKATICQLSAFFNQFRNDVSAQG